MSSPATIANLIEQLGFYLQESSVTREAMASFDKEFLLTKS